MTLDEMKRVAEAATPGPWQHDISERGNWDRVWLPAWTQGEQRHIEASHDVSRARDDAAFIATFDPPTVRALLAVVEAAKDHAGENLVARPLVRALAALGEL